MQQDVVTVGVDLAKNVFQVSRHRCGWEGAGAPTAPGGLRC